MKNNVSAYEKVSAKMAEIFENLSPELSVTENMEEILKAEFPECDAHEIVSQLIEGGKDFDRRMEDEDEIEWDFASMTQEELNARYSFYVNSLNTVHDMLRDKPELHEQMGDIGRIDAHTDDVSVEDVSEIAALYDKTLEEFSPLMFDNEASASVFDELNSEYDINLTAAHQHYLALVLYILFRQGEINAPSPLIENAKALGAFAGAAYTAMKAKLEAWKTNYWDDLRKVYKRILDVLECVLWGAGAAAGYIVTAITIALAVKYGIAASLQFVCLCLLAVAAVFAVAAVAVTLVKAVINGEAKKFVVKLAEDAATAARRVAEAVKRFPEYACKYFSIFKNWLVNAVRSFCDSVAAFVKNTADSIRSTVGNKNVTHEEEYTEDYEEFNEFNEDYEDDEDSEVVHA